MPRITDEKVLKAIDEKMDQIYSDFEQNVLRIWGRRDVAVAVDLVFHSALSFHFQDDFIQRGYLELLVLGDSGQGKTTLVDKLMHHYEVGEKISGETTTRTGLVYSIQENQRRRFLQWGAVPLNDRRLLVIDEFSGIPQEEIENMSSLRATGIAEVNRSIKSRTAARTRLIFLSNSRDGKMLSSYKNGVEAVDKLFSKKEDIRRLDFAITVASGEIETSLINQKHKSTVEHLFTGRDCRNLILWCWSRKPNQIIFTDRTVDVILHYANELPKKYHAEIPLLEPSDTRIKLARLSVALAGRLFSTADLINLTVLPEHVEWIVAFLNRIYTKPSMGYDLFSQGRHSEGNIKSENAVLTILQQHSTAFLKRFLEIENIQTSDIEILIGDREKAKKFLTDLWLANALKKKYSAYRHTSAFIVLLKGLIAEREEVEGIPPVIKPKAQVIKNDEPF